MMKQGRSGVGAAGTGTPAGTVAPPIGPDVHPMSGSLGDDSGVPLHHPNDPLPPHITAPATPAGPTSLDWSVDPHASPQDQVNDIYGAPTIVNPPPAPAASPAGLNGIRRMGRNYENGGIPRSAKFLATNPYGDDRDMSGVR